MPTETRSLHRKLAQIMYEAERIPKNGRAPKEMGGYPFVQVGDAADFIRKALAEKVITMMPTAVQVVGQQDRPTKSGGSMTTVDLIVDWTLTDGESGESITIQSFGAGADGGDKYSGKASTSTMKYALLTGFLLSTGEDSELGNSEAATRKPPVEVLTASSVPSERPTIERTNGGLIGIASLGKPPVDGELRELPEGGYGIGFVIGDGRERVQAVATDPLASALAPLLGDVVGHRVQVFGPVTAETMTINRRAVPFSRIHIERIETPDWTLPVAVSEAESIPLLPLDDDEKAAIAGSLG